MDLATFKLMPATGDHTLTKLFYIFFHLLVKFVVLLCSNLIDLKCWLHLSVATFSLSCKSAMYVIDSYIGYICYVGMSYIVLCFSQ